MKKRVIITGTSGMLGKDIYSIFAKNPEYNVIGIDRNINNNIPENKQLIGNLIENEFIQRIVTNYKPELFIHCAAIVNLKYCEENESEIFNLHAEVPRKIIELSKGKTKLIYISSDSVFDGTKGNYAENDKPNPQNSYAKSKLKGESATLTNIDNIVIRTNIFGYNLPLRNSLAEWAIKNLKDKTQINGYTNVVFNAIYTKHLAKNILALISKNYRGLINIGSQNVLSKYSFLRLLSQNLTGNSELVKPEKLINIENGVKRPENTSLNVSKASKILSLPLIEDGIYDLVNDYKEESSNEN